MATDVLATPHRVVLPLHRAQEIWAESQRSRAVVADQVEQTCLCGGLIRAWNDDQAIAHAVSVHNASVGHTAWAIAAGWR